MGLIISYNNGLKLIAYNERKARDATHWVDDANHKARDATHWVCHRTHKCSQQRHFVSQGGAIGDVNW